VETDHTILFRSIAEADPGAGTGTDGAGHALSALFSSIEPAFYGDVTESLRAEWSEWLADHDLRRQRGGHRDGAARRAHVLAQNPRFVLRNYLAHEAIEAAEGGDDSRVAELLDLVRRPYDEQPGRERFAARRPEWARTKVGCSALSCSS
jgi:serine/tyrosine/threonine adenylyltransferase